MKTIKIVLLLATISFFTSIPFSAEAGDCSAYKSVVHKKICEKLSGISSDKATVSDEATTKKKKYLITTDGKVKNKAKGFFEKLKNMGGKNIGEPG